MFPGHESTVIGNKEMKRFNNLARRKEVGGRNAKSGNEKVL